MPISAVPSAPTEPTPAAICAVIVTFNPDAFSFDSVGTILKEAAHTVILDNRSAEPARQKLRLLSGANLTLIENAANAGVAGGLNLGIKAAVEKGYRWFLLFDQDTKIFSDSIRSLTDAHAQCFSELGRKLGFLGSNYHLHFLAENLYSDANVPFSEGKLWSTGQLVLTSGTLISWENFQAIGSFREDFFIDHVDHEYQLRAMRRGLVVARTALPLLVHRLGMQHHCRRWLALGQKKASSNYSPLRRYYQVRNFAALAREYEKEFPDVVENVRRSVRRDTFRALKYEGGFLKNLIAIVLGRRDGRRGVLGKYNGRIAL